MTPEHFDYYTARVAALPRTVTESGCHEWRGDVNNWGYGRIPSRRDANGKRKHLRIHCLVYELTHGPIPPGMYVCHTCDNPPCFNIEHLWLGTPTDNARDEVRKLRHANLKLTPEQVLEIRSRYAAGGITQARLAPEYGITPANVHAITSGRSWKHLLGDR